jgi:hypothetical protein
MSESRPSVTACILAHSSRGGLARLLGEIDGLVDEIVMGVDAGSRDDTLEIARSGADVVFRFEHVGPPVRARLLPLRHATGDWILSLDEDEGLDDRFGPLLCGLVADPRYSHYWFPRQWLVDLSPPAYLHAAPWFPDWQLRLFRNQPARVWHNGRVHSGYRVMGTGCREDRTAILHYEPLALTAGEREAKVAYYRAHGGEGRSDDAYQSTAGWERRPLTARPAASAAERRARAGRLVAKVAAVPEAPVTPPWGAALEVRMPETAGCRRMVVADVTAHNTGRLEWAPPGGGWPQLHLSHHLLSAAGAPVRWDGERIPMPRVVAPGERARFLFTFRAPEEPGSYLLEWDLVSEGECWFAECGGRSVRAPLRVVAA